MNIHFIYSSLLAFYSTLAMSNLRVIIKRVTRSQQSINSHCLSFSRWRRFLQFWGQLSFWFFCRCFLLKSIEYCLPFPVFPFLTCVAWTPRRSKPPGAKLTKFNHQPARVWSYIFKSNVFFAPMCFHFCAFCPVFPL